MKRTLLLLGCCSLLSLPRPAAAVDFELHPREPGPGHRTPTYWWKFNGASWELVSPDHFTLSGGGELRLQQVDHPEVAAVCRPSSPAEREALTKPDPAAQDAFFRTLLPSGIKDLKLVSQMNNPLPVNGLNNVEADYSYELGGVQYRAAFMVNRAVQPPDKKAGPTAKPKEDYFTAVITAPQETQSVAYGALQQLLATARVAPEDASSDQGNQVATHNMLGH